MIGVQNLRGGIGSVTEQNPNYKFLIDLLFDILTSGYAIAAGSAVFNYTSGMGGCYPHLDVDDPLPECQGFWHIFRIVATIWAVIAILLGYVGVVWFLSHPSAPSLLEIAFFFSNTMLGRVTHLVLFILRIRRHFDANRTVGWMGIRHQDLFPDGVIASLNFTIGPVGFNASFRLLQPVPGTTSQQEHSNNESQD